MIEKITKKIPIMGVIGYKEEECFVTSNGLEFHNENDAKSYQEALDERVDWSRQWNNIKKTNMYIFDKMYQWYYPSNDLELKFIKKYILGYDYENVSYLLNDKKNGVLKSNMWFAYNDNEDDYCFYTIGYFRKKISEISKQLEGMI